MQQISATYRLVKDLGAAWVSGNTSHIVERDVQQAKQAPCQVAGCNKLAVRIQDLQVRFGLADIVVDQHLEPSRQRRPLA